MINLMKRILACTLCAVFCAAAAEHWIPVNAGLPVTTFGISLVAVDPVTPSTAYAVTNLGTIYQTTDSATGWHPVRGIARVTFLAIDPQNSSTLYAITNYTLSKSADGGATWTPIQTNFNGGVGRAAVDPFHSSTLYATSFGYGYPLFKSTDSGASWSQLSNMPFPASSLIGYIAFDPSTPGMLYVTREGGDILKSADSGATWTALQTRNGAVFAWAPLLVDPRSPSTLYAGSFAAFTFNPPFDDGLGAIAKSTDGGATWTVIRTGIPAGTDVASLAIDGADRIYATYTSGNGWGIVKSLDGGQSWSVANAFPQGQGSSVVATSATSPSIVYLGYSNFDSQAGGILKSSDGATWTSANTGLDFIDLRALKSDPNHLGVFYVAGAGGVFKSADSAATWSALGLGQTGVVRSLLIDSTNPWNLYAGAAYLNQCTYTDQLVFKSVDGGADWNSISPPESGCLVTILGGSSAGVMAIDPVNPSVIYLQETDSEDGAFTLLKSSDGGGRWNAIWNWPDLPSGVNALLIDPTDTAAIYAGLNGVYGAAGGVFRSSDGGASWNSTSFGQGAVTALAMDPADHIVLYAAGPGGVFRSTNEGAQWTAVGAPPIAPGVITALVIHPGRSEVLYAATSTSGIFRSTDSGVSWSKINDGLASFDVRALGFAPGFSNALFAATASGIFQLTGGEVHQPLQP